MIGSYGFHASVTPNAVGGPRDLYTDYAADTQYERQIGSDELTVHGSYVYERSNLNATFTAAGAGQARHNLKSAQGDAIYHWGTRFSVTGSLFGIRGTTDSTLFGMGTAITGSASGNPASDGYIVQGNWWPKQNVTLLAQYTGYWKFNGGSGNYDGLGRNARDNNVLYLRIALWF